MLNAHPTLDFVYAVKEAIPALGARPGDELYVRLGDPDYPIEIRRTFTADVLAAIPDTAVRMLDVVPHADVHVPAEPVQRPVAPAPVVRLVG